MDFQSDTTITRIRRLRPYSLSRNSNNIDIYVQSIINERCEEDTISALNEYARGMYDIELHYKNFMNFEHPVAEERELAFRLSSDASVIAAIEQVREDLSVLRGVRPIPSNQMDSIKWIGSSAAGYGYIGDKRSNYELARHNASWCIHQFERYGTNLKFVPDKAFARSQLSLKATPKIRHVWGEAFHHILIESLLGQPLLERLLITENPIFIGVDLHKDMPSRIIGLIEEQKHYCYCLDFSGFDSSICRWLIGQAFELLRELFLFENDFERMIFDLIKTLFMNRPVVMPDGQLYLVQCGVPSGSYFTQIIDSIVNLILIYSFQINMCRRTFPTYVLGDDSIFASPTLFATHQQCYDYFKEFRMTVNVDKSLITQNWSEILFLGHNFYGSRVTRMDFTCLSLALHSEDPVESPQRSIIRVASLLYDSGFNSYSMLNLYRMLLDKYQIDWTQEIERPMDRNFPFTNLFVIS